MAQYLSSETIRAAVERLAKCAANSTLTDFLIFRRALKITGPAKGTSKAATQVVTGTQSEPFRRAIDEMTGCATRDIIWSGQPHYSPFASQRDNGRGFKSAKYPSNGPSDTVAGWQSRGNSPLRLVPDSKPKAYSFVNRTEDELRAFFIKKAGKVEVLEPTHPKQPERPGLAAVASLLGLMATLGCLPARMRQARTGAMDRRK